MMQIKSPIFLNCFSRGGSNILWNMFLSHPAVCSPIYETLEIFRFDRHGLTRAGWQAIWYSRQWRLFDQWYLRPRRPISYSAQKYIDKVFFKQKELTFTDVEMRYRAPGQTYTLQEVHQARLVAKNNNGLAFLSDIFQTMYPDGTFVALVRDPIALYESYKRRGIVQTVMEFAHFYETIAHRMLEDQKQLPHYHILRFEDMLGDPVTTIKQVYQWANLDFAAIKQVRFKAKAHLQADGQHTTTYQPGQHYWFELGEMHQILEPGINTYQKSRLEESEQIVLLNLTRSSRESLDY